MLNEHDPLIERHAEQEAVARLLRASTSFSAALVFNQLSEDLVVIGKDGKKETFHGKDLVNQKTWTRFLTDTTPVLDLARLAYHAGSLADRYVTWLLTSSTARYRQIKRQEERNWLRNVALLAVLWHQLEHKYTTHTFLDRRAEAEMGKLLDARQLMHDITRAVHHVVKGEAAFTMIEQLHQNQLEWIENCPRVPYDSLPALPEGVPDPLALPSEPEEENHE